MINYFDLFNLKISFNIGKKELHNQYLLLLKDKSKNRQEVITGYKILNNDFTRVEHILAVLKVEISSFKLGNNELLNIFEIQNEIEELSINQQKELLLQKKTIITDNYSKISEDLDIAIEKNDVEKIKISATMIRYHYRIIERIEDLLQI
jgi:hypothetical protein